VRARETHRRVRFESFIPTRKEGADARVPTFRFCVSGSTPARGASPRERERERERTQPAFSVNDRTMRYQTVIITLFTITLLRRGTRDGRAGSSDLIFDRAFWSSSLDSEREAGKWREKAKVVNCSRIAVGKRGMWDIYLHRSHARCETRVERIFDLLSVPLSFGATLFAQLRSLLLIEVKFDDRARALVSVTWSLLLEALTHNPEENCIGCWSQRLESRFNFVGKPSAEFERDCLLLLLKTGGIVDGKGPRRAREELAIFQLESFPNNSATNKDLL